MQVAVRRAIIVCALGYFIDVFDIQLFAVLRIPSLTELGVSPDQLSSVGGYILNAQMLGMISGAFLWGFLGDCFGRIKALYGSILVYSIGTLLCSLTYDTLSYGCFRCLTGFGLAGETGVAITLISELMSSQKRAWGIAMLAGFGTLGPVAAVIMSFFMPWRTTYVIAGILGLILFLLRMRLIEASLFKKILKSDEVRGTWKILMQPQQRFAFLCCVVMGFPLTYCWFLLNFFSLEFSHALLKEGEIFSQKTCLILFYVGASSGTVLCGTLSQIWRKRRKAIATMLLLGVLTSQSFLLLGPLIKFTSLQFYCLYYFIGVSGGGWAFFAAVAAEHFGTNIRATTCTVMSNLLRGFSIPMIFVFQFLRQSESITNAAALIGAVLYVGAFWALSQLRETHGTSLDYIETID